ncbi:pectate lyase [Uliginosibacterium aquaticum]|uniref:Pectate lyase n=1 Tax=Uliginosibacterium aquaticum TaxID=2731212 RepID=A0ABX2IKE2_9RHOO|nr:pectate lyase [Uliginosibacterium aquaticum]NSL56957.1 pectate lyase [Uliginosibacterium aquaticum]
MSIQRFARAPLAASLLLASSAVFALPAFPGAEGFGADTVAGRGGRVIAVTNLNDAGPGSLRAAVETEGPRTVVFRVAGTIHLQSPLAIRHPNITLAGQTSPGGGVTVAGYTTRIYASDVVLRYMRFRLGNLTKTEDDALGVMHGARRVVIDHVSAGWSTDESLSTEGDVADITIQWSLIAESLNKSVHAKGAHGYGSLLRVNGGVSLHHNVYAHHRGRNPRFGDNYFKNTAPGSIDFRNNVIYGWGDYASGTNDGWININYVNNYIKPAKYSVLIEPLVMTDKATPDKIQLFVAGNFMQGNAAASRDNSRLLGAGAPPDKVKPAPDKYTVAAQAFAAPAVTTWPALDAFIRVLSDVGASSPWRDSVDLRVIEQVSEGSGRIIDSQEEVGSWPAVPQGTPPLDTDGDGIPDDWEIAQRLDPKNPADGAKLARNGYSNLENWLNSLVSSPVARPAR